MEYLGVFIIALAGAFGGLSSGVGLFVIYEQPKNIKVQLTLGAIALVLLVIWLIFFSKNSI